MIRKNSGLPPRVYAKNGSYYLVTLQNRWLKLCRVSAGLPEMYRQLAKVTDADATRELMPGVIARWADSKRKEWAVGVALEARTGHTFRSAGRDTWPAGMKELGEAFASGRPLRKSSRGTTCRVCSL